MEIENLVSSEGTYKIFRDNKGTEYAIVGQSDEEYFGFRIGDDQRSHGKKNFFTETGKVLDLKEVDEIVYRSERSWLTLSGGSPRDKVDEYGVVVDFEDRTSTIKNVSDRVELNNPMVSINKDDIENFIREFSLKLKTEVCEDDFLVNYGSVIQPEMTKSEFVDHIVSYRVEEKRKDFENYARIEKSFETGREMADFLGDSERALFGHIYSYSAPTDVYLLIRYTYERGEQGDCRVGPHDIMYRICRRYLEKMGMNRGIVTNYNNIVFTGDNENEWEITKFLDGEKFNWYVVYGYGDSILDINIVTNKDGSRILYDNKRDHCRFKPLDDIFNTVFYPSPCYHKIMRDSYLKENVNQDPYDDYKSNKFE